VPLSGPLIGLNGWFEPASSESWLQVASDRRLTKNSVNGVRISFAFRVAAIAVLLAVIVIVETRHPFAIFRLVSLGVVFFLLVYIASLLCGNWRDFLLVLTSLAFGIFLIEAAANIWEPK
jgi:hypothetical protein